MSVKGNEKALKRQVSQQFQGKRQIPFTAAHHEIGHGCEISWAVRAKEAPEQIKAAWPVTARKDDAPAAIQAAVTASRSRSDTCSSPACAPLQKPCCD